LDGVRYDLVVMLQPTSPLRRPEHVRACVEKLVQGGWDAVWSVSTTDIKFHPLKQLKLDGDGKMDYFDPAGSRIIARQQLQPVYHRNGVAYAITRSCLLEQKSILGGRASAVIVDEELANIDTLEDFEKAERLVRARQG
jgi:CMP-N-acetylneuraminic acid synthetase